MRKVLRRLVRQSPAMVVAMIALFVALSGTAVATTSVLITGKQVANGSITGVDIKNKSIGVADLAAKARGARGLRGLAGPAGAQGPQGPQGLQGIQGVQGPAGVVGAVTVQRTDVALADNTTQAVEASCPAGQKAIGGGSSVDQTGSDDIKLLVSRPGNGGFIPADGQGFNDWRAVYRNPAGGTGAAEIRAFVICAQA